VKVRAFLKTGGLLVAGALAFPAAAAAHIDVAVSSVRAHTDHADAALERAVALYEQNAQQRATRSLNRSRSQLGKATAEAAKLLRSADTPAERVAAARALRLVASQRHENIEQLVGVLPEATSSVENTIARAALTDTRGRDNALAILQALLGQVPADAVQGINRAIAALSTDRSAEVRVEARALTSARVSARAKRTVARSLARSVDGQTTAAEKLAQLIASPAIPQAAKPGLTRAYDAIIADHGSVADILSRFSDRMPAFVRSFVERVITQARQDARSMRDNRPTPPGQGGTTPGGPPTGTPGGPPSDTPGGPPSGTPGPPSGTP
jgi:hypothetical protein